MQEMDIKNKLNDELEAMAPDILAKIIDTPIEPIENGEELLRTKDKLFTGKNKIKVWLPIATAVAACILVLISILNPISLSLSFNQKSEVAFNIIVDVNPSINIKVNKDGIVEELIAENKDAAKIAKQINKKLDDESDYKKIVKKVIRKLNKNGYLKNEENAMLVSIISDDKNTSKEKIDIIKKQTKKVEEKKEIKCTSVFQVCEKNDEVEKVAKENKVSIGKATLCIKLAKEEKTNVKNMCKKSIDDLVKKVENNKKIIRYDDEIVVEAPLSDEETSTDVETTESETTFEETSAEETSTSENETTTSEYESTTEENTKNVETTAPEDIPETVGND